MMTHLMHHDMGNKIIEGNTDLDPFVEKRTTIESDDRRELARCPAGMLAHRSAVIKAAQLPRVFDSHFAKGLIVRELLHPHFDVPQMLAEDIRQALDCRTGQALQQCAIRGSAGVSHACFMRGNLPLRYPLLRSAIVISR